jgi:hypothetical protein
MRQRAAYLESVQRLTTSTVQSSPHILSFAAGQLLSKIQISGAAFLRNQEVVDVLSIRDLNTLCRIHEMRKEQIIALEEKRERFKKMRESPW